MVAGTVEADGELLAEGDALRTVDSDELHVRATADAEILFWEMRAQARSALR
ncbi:hypothetical protein GCM10009551_080220 [Nocardiopsis tropica]